MVYHVPNYKLCVSNGIKWMFHERGRAVRGPLLLFSKPALVMLDEPQPGLWDHSGRCVLPSMDGEYWGYPLVN